MTIDPGQRLPGGRKPSAQQRTANTANSHDADRNLRAEQCALATVRRGSGPPLDLALAWARLGFRVHPAHPDPAAAKKPLIEGYQKKATTDPRQIRRWWTKWPKALIATPSDDYWLLDCDNPNKNVVPKDGIGNAERLFGSLEELSSARFYSPSDGINVMFRRRPDEHPISTASLIAPGIDTRGLLIKGDTASGQFILPGSRRSDGKGWRWCEVSEDFDPRHASFAPDAVIRAASLSKHARDLMAASPELAAALADAPLVDIPRLLAEHEATHRRQKSTVPAPGATSAEGKRRRAYALAGIAGDAATLSAMAPDSGRDAMAHARACRWAKYVGAGLISEAELVEPLLQACRANGLTNKNPETDVRRSITNGIKKFLNEPLDDLDDHPEPQTSTKKGPTSGDGATPPPPDDGPPPPKPSAFMLTPGPLNWPELTDRGMPVGRSQANIRHFLDASSAALCHNEFTAQPCITVDDVTRPLNDEILAQIRMAMHRARLNPSERFVEVALLDLALENGWHPVRQYLQSLAWDGTPRLDTWLSTYLGVEDSELHRAWGRCHLLAAVQRILRPGCKHDAILVFEGAQGLGKSRAIATLAGPFFTDALKVGQDAKEIIELTGGSWLVEFAEMEGISNREMSAIKSMLSRCSDKARLAYGRSTSERRRQWVAFGTVNDKTYLRDPTGNRRFWSVEVTRIDLAALARDRDQIWAEAMHRLAQGESPELPEHLYAAAAEAQEKRVLATPWEMRLGPTLENVFGRIAVEDLFQFLGVEPHRQDGNVGAQLNRAMRRLDWHKAQQRRDRQQTHCYERKPKDGTRSPWLRYDHVTRGWVTRDPL
jgi:putative DNA primase/helicase